MIKELIDFFLHIDVYLTSLIHIYGNLSYVLLFFLIFIETGFVFTPFLPGDSLLFLSGTFASTGVLNVYILFLIFSIAAILGDTVNYWLGSYFGEKVFSKFIRHEHMERTKLFFHHYGKKTIVIARFVPIVRTFTPFVAGIGKMKYATFLSYNIIGGIAWVAVFLLSGFYFGTVPYVKDNLSIVIILIIIVSIVPAIVEYIRGKNKRFK